MSASTYRLGIANAVDNARLHIEAAMPLTSANIRPQLAIATLEAAIEWLRRAEEWHKAWDEDFTDPAKLNGGDSPQPD